MSRKKAGRECLLVWIQSRTSGYSNVNVVDFTDSWVDGLAFCALLHSFCPELVNFNDLTPATKTQNLEFAFSLAEKLGIPRLIEPTDMLVESGPDKFFVITYLAQFIDRFKQQQQYEPEPVPLGFIRQYETQNSNKQLEAERTKRVRSNTTHCIDRINLVKSGMVSGTIRELKRKVSLQKIMTSPLPRRRGGTVTERIAEFNRKTGSQTKHVAGDAFISERVPSGLVAGRIAAYLKNQAQIRLDIEYIMVTSPKLQRAKQRDGLPPISPKFMSSIYYVMRQQPSPSSSSSSNTSAEITSTTAPLEQ